MPRTSLAFVLALALGAPRALAGARASAATARQEASVAVAPSAAAAERIRARCDAELERALAELGAPGASAALVLPGGEGLAFAAGFADREAARAMTPADRLLSGSIGKTYVAALVLELDALGKLDLDDPLAKTLGERAWFDRLPNARAITLRQLLRHQSGLERYEFDPEFFPAAFAEPDRVWRPEELLAYVFDHAPLFEPGRGWAYADTNYILLGLVIEAMTGERFYERVRARLLEPHGLTDTVPSDSRRIPGLCQGYAVFSRALGCPERLLEDGVFVYNPQFEWCGGGYANTPLDLARWARILFSGDAFDAPGASYLDEMLDAVDARELGRGVRYGLGVIVSETEHGPRLGHDGFMTGYCSTMGYLPEPDLAFALQFNSDDVRRLNPALEALRERFVAIALEELGG